MELTRGLPLEKKGKNEKNACGKNRILRYISGGHEKKKFFFSLTLMNDLKRSRSFFWITVFICEQKRFLFWEKWQKTRFLPFLATFWGKSTSVAKVR